MKQAQQPEGRNRELRKLAFGWFSFTCCEDSTILLTELLNDHLDEWTRVVDHNVTLVSEGDIFVWPDEDERDALHRAFQSLGDLDRRTVFRRVSAAENVDSHLVWILAPFRATEHVCSPRPDHRLEAPGLLTADPAFIPEACQLGQTSGAGDEYPDALVQLQPSHVLRYLVLALEGRMGCPNVTSHDVAIWAPSCA